MELKKGRAKTLGSSRGEGLGTEVSNTGGDVIIPPPYLFGYARKSPNFLESRVYNKRRRLLLLLLLSGARLAARLWRRDLKTAGSKLDAGCLLATIKS